MKTKLQRRIARLDRELTRELARVVLVAVLTMLACAAAVMIGGA